MGNFNLKDLVITGAGLFILLDRGASWMFIAGLALLAVGATRVARNI